MTIGIKRLLPLAAVLSLLIGPTSALAQQPDAPGPFGAGDLFKKEASPFKDQADPFKIPGEAPRPAENLSQMIAEEQVRQIAQCWQEAQSLILEERCEEADARYARAISLAENSQLGSLFLVHALFLRANLKAHLSRFAESRELIRRAALDCEESWSYQDRQMEFMIDLAVQVYRFSWRMSDLDPIYRRLCYLEARSLGIDHPQVARHSSDLAHYLVRQGKVKGAEEVFSNRLALVEQQFGLESPKLDEALGGFLQFHREEAREAEAEKLLRDLLARREGQLGPNHEKVAETFLTYSKWLRQSGRDVEADSCLARSVGIRCRNDLVGLTATRKVASSLAWLNRSGL